ncbi:DUF2059 domain-containing protein [Roseomonas elaeocarpi]|uniref:DUF2059 domain-containing protein n=1 Tax=Roseomonas elaeocarpi TaxID=907779 RepID=A0ABV6JUQ1_9PROT
MNSFRSAALAVAVLLPLAGGSALAQAPAPARPAPTAPVPAAPMPAMPNGGATQPVAPERMAAARELANSLNLKATIDQMMPLMRSSMLQQMQAVAPKVPAADIATVLDDAILPEIKAQSGDFVELAAGVWAQNFTVEEIAQLKAFYDTPLGRKSLTLTPQITQQTMAVAQGWAGRVITDAIAKNRDALRAKGINL